MVEGVNTTGESEHTLQLKSKNCSYNILRSRVVEGVNTTGESEHTLQLKPGFSFKRLLLGWLQLDTTHFKSQRHVYLNNA